MAKGGRIEAAIVFAANVTFQWTDSAGGPLTVTVTAGTYYITDLCATIQTAIRNLAGTVGDGATVSVSNGESGTGKVTITGSTFSITWTSTDLRDVLGFAGNITSQTSVTGDKHAKGMWIPSVPKWTKHGDDEGDDNSAVYVSDLRQTVSPQGHVKTLVNTRYSEYRGIRWEGVPQARARRMHESVTGESFERFWLDCILGDQTYFQVGSALRLYWDAGASDYIAVRLVGMPEFDPGLLVESWPGRYVIELPRLIVIPA